MRGGRGGRGRGRGSANPQATAILNATMREIGISASQMRKSNEEPPPIYPALAVEKAFPWQEDDQPVWKIAQSLQSKLAASPYNIKAKKPEPEIARYTDKYLGDSGPPTVVEHLRESLNTAYFPRELVDPQGYAAAVRQITGGARPKLRRKGSYDAELRILADKERRGQGAGAADDEPTKEKDGDEDEEAAGDDDDEELEEGDLEDYNDYAQNYGDSDAGSDGGDSGGGGEATY